MAHRVTSASPSLVERRFADQEKRSGFLQLTRMIVQNHSPLAFDIDELDEVRQHLSTALRYRLLKNQSSLGCSHSSRRSDLHVASSLP